MFVWPVLFFFDRKKLFFICASFWCVLNDLCVYIFYLRILCCLLLLKYVINEAVGTVLHSTWGYLAILLYLVSLKYTITLIMYFLFIYNRVQTFDLDSFWVVEGGHCFEFYWLLRLLNGCVFAVDCDGMLKDWSTLMKSAGNTRILRVYIEITCGFS